MPKRKISKGQSSIDSWDSEKPILISLPSIPISHKNHILGTSNENDKDIIYDDEDNKEDQNLRSEQIFIDNPKFNKKFSPMCHFSKNLYNSSIYEIRQSFTGHINEELRKKISVLLENKPEGYQTKIYKFLDGYFRQNNDENYTKLPEQSVQQTIKLATDAWFSNEQSREKYETDLEKRKDYTGKPGICGYKRTDESIMIFTNQQCHIERKEKFDKRRINDPIPGKIIKYYLIFPPELGIPDIPTRLPVSKSRGGNIDLRHVRIIPMNIGYNIEIVYKKVISEKKQHLIEKFMLLSQNRIMGIDLGVNNIMAIVNNIGNHPIIIKNGIIKSTNQWFNKITSELISIYMRQQGFKGEYSKGIPVKMGKKFKILSQNRSNLIKDIFHKLSRFVVRYCLKDKIGTIVIGLNKFWKQFVNMGKISNQNFVYIPHSKLIKMIKYKAREYGIKVIVHEESYTSKCSFLDNETIEYHDIYMGKRLTDEGHRGLFRTNKGILINSDINGAYNVIRKCIPNAFDNIDGHGLVGGVVLRPMSLNLKDLFSNKFKNLIL